MFAQNIKNFVKASKSYRFGIEVVFSKGVRPLPKIRRIIVIRKKIITNVKIQKKLWMDYLYKKFTILDKKLSIKKLKIFLKKINVSRNLFYIKKIIALLFLLLSLAKKILIVVKSFLGKSVFFRFFSKEFRDYASLCLEKDMWTDAFYFTMHGLRYKRIKRLSKRLGRYKKLNTQNFMKKKPEALIYSRKSYGRNSLKRLADWSSAAPLLHIVDMNVKFTTRVVYSLVRRRIRNLAKWAHKKIKQRFKRRRMQMRLSQGWGNAGKYHFLKYKKERFLMRRELVMITGKEYFSKKRGIFIENRLKFDKFVSFPLPRVKRNKRTLVSTNTVKWLNSGYHVLECSKFADIKFSLLTITSNHGNVVSRSSKFGHVFHLVSPSVLPMTFSWVLFLLIQDLLNSMWLEFWYTGFWQVMGHVTMATFLFATILSWILEIYSEEQSGAHSLEVQKGFRYAILLFILSELMLFISFFWAYFHFSLNSNSFTGGSYTPNGLVPFYWFRIPLLNTLLLLASGLSLTIAHILMVENDKIVKVVLWLKVLGNFRIANWIVPLFENTFRSVWYKGYKYLARYKWFIKRMQHTISRFSLSKKKSTYIKNFGDRSYNHVQRFGRVAVDLQINLPKSFLVNFNAIPRETGWQANFWLIDTVIKGFIFLIYQAYEYTSCMFSINDGVYGAVFFSLTGLHGLHVFIGVMFIFISFSANLKKSYGRFFNSKKTWRRFIHIYLDKGALPKNCYTTKLWTNRIAFDGAAWYWHFVDVVWLFVFIFVYWWGFSVA